MSLARKCRVVVDTPTFKAVITLDSSKNLQSKHYKGVANVNFGVVRGSTPEQICADLDQVAGLDGILDTLWCEFAVKAGLLDESERSASPSEVDFGVTISES